MRLRSSSIYATDPVPIGANVCKYGYLPEVVGMLNTRAVADAAGGSPILACIFYN